MENETLNGSSKKKYLLAIVLMAVAVLGASAYVLMRPEAVNDQQASPSPEVTATPAPAGSPDAINLNVKTFTVLASNFSFSLKEIRVQKGDTVKINFQNTAGMHDWVIDEFGARTPILSSGGSDTVEFVADKTGTFQYYCSVGSHRANGMWGTLIVE